MTTPSDPIAAAVAELKRRIEENPGATVILGHSQYEGDVREVIQHMVFEEE